MLTMCLSIRNHSRNAMEIKKLLLLASFLTFTKQSVPSFVTILMSFTNHIHFTFTFHPQKHRQIHTRQA